MYVSSTTGVSTIDADVSITVDFFGSHKVFQETTVIGTCHVLGGDIHGTEFVEFVVFDVLGGGNGLEFVQVGYGLEVKRRAIGKLEIGR